MKLKRFTIENYKALGHLDVRLNGDLLFLIGVNGAGKSSVLQALALVRHFAAGSTSAFFKDRGWNPVDARPKTVGVTPLRAASGTGGRLQSGRNLGIALAFEHEGFHLLWSFRWSYSAERTLEESVWIMPESARAPSLVVRYPTSNEDSGPFAELQRLARLRLSGSIFSLIDVDDLANSLEHSALIGLLSTWAEQIKSLELLNPATMRNRVRSDAPDIGSQGGSLASFLAALSSEAKDGVVRRMASFYPISDLETTRKRAGWIDMQVAERFKLMGRVGLNHMSDGFLRILALCAIPEFGEDGLVLLDEVEDGIEPHVLPRLIERIAAESTSQLVMTSHSPLLINYFDPYQIFIMARDRNGQTIGSPAETLPTFSDAENYLGSGEIWANSAMDSIYASLPRYRAPRRSILYDPTLREVGEYLRG